MTVHNIPTGIQQLVEVVDQLKAVMAELEAAEAEVTRLRQAVAEAEVKVRQMAALAQCGPECDEHTASIPASAKASSNGSAQAPTTPAPVVGPALDDASVPIVWRLAYHLVRHPRLDYQATAAAIWPNEAPPPKVAKNRLNAQLTRLKTLRIARSLGNNEYEIDRAALIRESPPTIADRRLT